MIKSANRLWLNANMEIDMSEFAILTERLGLPVTPVPVPQPGVDRINEMIAGLTNKCCCHRPMSMGIHLAS